jgi:hypothetical protein
VQLLDEPDRPAARSPLGAERAVGELGVLSGTGRAAPGRPCCVGGVGARPVRTRRVAELEQCLRGISSCSTCEACQSAAVRMLSAHRALPARMYRRGY